MSLFSLARATVLAHLGKGRDKKSLDEEIEAKRRLMAAERQKAKEEERNRLKLENQAFEMKKKAVGAATVSCMPPRRFDSIMVAD